MFYEHDTDTSWTLSQKGNHLRRIGGVVLVVGRQKKGRGYWARVGEDYLAGEFETKIDAQAAAELKAKKLPRRNIFAKEIDEL